MNIDLGMKDALGSLLFLEEKETEGEGKKVLQPRFLFKAFWKWADS